MDERKIRKTFFMFGISAGMFISAIITMIVEFSLKDKERCECTKTIQNIEETRDSIQ